MPNLYPSDYNLSQLWRRWRGDEESSQMQNDDSWWNIAKAVGQHFLGDDGKFDQEKFNQFMMDGSWWNIGKAIAGHFLGDEESSQMIKDGSWWNIAKAVGQ